MKGGNVLGVGERGEVKRGKGSSIPGCNTSIYKERGRGLGADHEVFINFVNTDADFVVNGG